MGLRSQPLWAVTDINSKLPLSQAETSAIAKILRDLPANSRHARKNRRLDREISCSATILANHFYG
jgi:hypothetical protein